MLIANVLRYVAIRFRYRTTSDLIRLSDVPEIRSFNSSASGTVAGREGKDGLKKKRPGFLGLVVGPEMLSPGLFISNLRPSAMIVNAL